MTARESKRKAEELRDYFIRRAAENKLSADKEGRSGLDWSAMAYEHAADMLASGFGIEKKGDES